MIFTFTLHRLIFILISIIFAIFKNETLYYELNVAILEKGLSGIWALNFPGAAKLCWIELIKQKYRTGQFRH